MNPNPHIEIKTRYIDARDVQQMIQKGTIIAVVTTAKISKPAKQKLDDADIAWAEKISINFLQTLCSPGEEEC